MHQVYWLGGSEYSQLPEDLNNHRELSSLASQWRLLCSIGEPRNKSKRFSSQYKLNKCSHPTSQSRSCQ